MQGPEGLVWINQERAALQAFLSFHQSKEGINVPILEVGEGVGSPGDTGVLPEGGGLRERRDGA